LAWPRGSGIFCNLKQFQSASIMKFRNLFKEHPGHYSDPFLGGMLYPVQAGRRTEEQRNEFAAKWSSGEASAGDWVNASRVEVIAAEQKLSREQMDIVRKRRMVLYDWWLEYRVQHQWMKQLLEVTRYAPHQVKAYAKFELEQLGLFLAGSMSNERRLQYRLEKSIGFTLDYTTIVSAMAEGYMRIYDVWDPAHYQYGEALLRYKEYLECIAMEGLEEEPAEDFEDTLYGNVMRDVALFSRNLTVEYRSTEWDREKESFVDHEITGVSGWRWPEDLRRRLEYVFECRFDELLLKLPEVSYEEQRDLLDSVKWGIETLYRMIEETTYIRQWGQPGPKTPEVFKRYVLLKYRGDRDLQLVFDKKARDFMDYRLGDFVKEWEEGIRIMVRKVEHTVNNLNLLAVYAEKAIYDIEKIFDNTFVLESEAWASQATAFYLRGFGIVTCDHCVRKNGDEPFYPDLVLYRRNDLKRKARVTVVKSHAHLDLAILKLTAEEDDFLGEGLEKGDSDVVRQLDQVVAAGFPNYNFGDSGVTTEGKVIGMRAISGVQHFLVSNPLVEGNSGGPVFNKEGRVIGVVVTGSDSLRTAPKTEKHGLVPINTLNLLL